MKKTKFMSLIAILLMFVVALTCGFLFACSSDDEDEVTDQGTVEETPTDSTDPTEPTEPTDPTEPTEPTEPSEDTGEILVSIYDGTAENFGGNNYFADFRNLHELTVVATAAEDGSAIYTIEGMATLMTKSQIYAFNAGENEDGAKTGDAFIIVEIAAPEGSKINYNGVEVEVTDDPTDGVFIQRITEDGATERSVTITYADKAPVSFVISLEGVTIPSDYVIGTWSNTIEASAKVISTTYTVTADVELTFEEDGTCALVIYTIEGEGLENYQSIIALALPYTIEGTWSVEDGTYNVKFSEEGEGSTFTLGDDPMEVALSFETTFAAIININVEDQTLVPGTLTKNANGTEE